LTLSRATPTRISRDCRASRTSWCVGTRQPSSRNSSYSQGAGGNAPPRSLDVIADEIHALDRRNAFEIGALLAEARKSEHGNYGEWQEWLEQFGFSYQTALNYISAHELKRQTGLTFAGVPVRVVYTLGDDLDRGDLSEGDLKAIVEALDQASKAAEKTLSVAACEDVITLARARIKWGDLPAATLAALADVQVKLEQADQSAGCCARAASGHTAAAPPRSVMNCRRLIRSPRRRGRAA
jgi:hypothetical protein